jgi:hypothetical protein
LESVTPAVKLGAMLASLLALLTVTAAPPLGVATRNAAVALLDHALRTYYVLPEVGQRAGAAVRAQRYTETEPEAFAAALTRDLQQVAHDRHLRVRFDPEFRGGGDPEAEPSAEERSRFERRVERHNFGVAKVEVLPGNVGLLDLRDFAPVAVAGPTLTAAIGVLAHTDALILDLRGNGGGVNETIPFLCSYFFPEGSRVHLHDIYNRPSNHTDEFWTRPSVPGPRYAGKPMYVLTSGRTFSAGEVMAYDLQALKRATLIGETTGGGANPGGPVALDGGLVAFIPTGRVINPITRTNWEGVGVKPDVAVPAARALEVAHSSAVRALLDHARDPEQRRALEQALHPPAN